MMLKVAIGLTLLCGLSAALPVPAHAALAAEGKSTLTPTTINGGYAIVVSKATLDDPDWAKVVKLLQAKYTNATVITFQTSVLESHDALARLMPRYTCFVGKPTEVGRVFCAQVHRMTRRLNDDPYTDTIWGIITGYGPEDACRLAAQQSPLLIHRGVGLGLNIGPFDEAIDFSDGKVGVTTRKKPDGSLEKTDVGEADRAMAFGQAVQDIQPDFMGSDGHASERALEMPWGKGSLQSRDGKLLAVDHTLRRGYMINSPNPKVYLAYGNCLIGHVDGPKALVLAIMHSLDVDQFVGYTVPTWYGKGGWGVNDWLFGQQGRWDLSESHFINQQFLLQELRARFPKNADYEITPEQFNGPDGHGDINAIAQTIQSGDRDELGMLWDRDTVVLWGDPAWDARFPAAKAYDWDQKLTADHGIYTLTITPHKDGKLGKAFAFLPHAVKAAKVTEGQATKPVIGAWFVMTPSVGDVTKGNPVVIRFTATTVAADGKPGLQG
jgi:hypothetical protein